MSDSTEPLRGTGCPIQVGSVALSPPLGIAPMAGMTDSAFRQLVKRHGECGLVVTEMVSSEGLVRGIDRTLEYAEYTPAERPISIQIFGGDPAKMAAAAQIVESMGADIVDVNMGCPVPKIARHQAGCSLMREPAHAASVIAAMTRAVQIPVTVKMRAGWDDGHRNAPELARMVEDAGAAAVTVHGRTAAQSYSGTADWDLVARVADLLTIPVFGSGDCTTPEQIVARLKSGVEGVLVGRGVLRNPWILAQAADLIAGRPAREVTPGDRARFLLDYIDLLLTQRLPEDAEHAATGGPEGPHYSRLSASAASSVATGGPESPHYSRLNTSAASSVATGGPEGPHYSRLSASAASSDVVRAFRPARSTSSHNRWVVNKIRALGSWYTKGFDHGSRLRTSINSAGSVSELRELIDAFFTVPA